MSKENYNALFSGVTQNLPRTEILVEDIFPFENQPFELYSEEKLEQLTKDIEENGLYSPIHVRPYKGGYQIISGHNRFNAIKRLGWATAPVTVETLTDEEAKIRLVNSNLYQRQFIKESEKVKAFSLKVGAIKNQGRKGSNALEFVAKHEKISIRTLSRYLACKTLIDDFLELLDKKKISLAIGELLGKISIENQQLLIDYTINNEVKFTLDNAKLLRELKDFTEENLDRIFFPLKEEEEATEDSEGTEEFNILDYFVSEEKYYEFKEKYMK